MADTLGIRPETSAILEGSQNLPMAFISGTPARVPGRISEITALGP